MKIVQTVRNLRPEFGFLIFSAGPKRLNPIGKDCRRAVAISGFECEHLTPKVMVGIASHRCDSDVFGQR
jgi:hypothetical protein